MAASPAPIVQRSNLAVSKQLPPWRRYAALVISGCVLLRFCWPTLLLRYAEFLIRRRIRALNPMLQRELRCEIVLPVLSKLGLQQALRILQQLQDESGNVQDPTAYVLVQASRSKRNGTPAGTPEGQPPRAPVSWQPPKPGSDVPQILRQRIWDINKAYFEGKEMRFDVIAPVLQAMKMEEALELLQDVESKANMLEHPTNYVLARAKANSGDPEASDADGALRTRTKQADSRSSDDFDRSLRQRIGWLNNNCDPPLQGRLMYNKVVQDLTYIGFKEAMTVLKELEKSAASIEDPSEWVVLQALSRIK